MLFPLFMFIMLMINFLFISSFHPLMLTISIIIQTLMLCLLLNTTSLSLWFSYILFLVFLGGMLILFIYITSLASNEKLYFNTLNSLFILFLIIMMTILFMIKFNLNYSLMMNQDSMNFQHFINFYESPHNLNKLYNYPNYLITITLICYLLITLIIVVYISNPNMGSLRQSY